MAIDSKVAFQNRALELGIDQTEVDALEVAGINSYAALTNLVKMMTLH